MDFVSFKTFIIGLFPFFILLLLSYFLFTTPPKNKFSNTLFAFFLILNAIEISGHFNYLFLKKFPKLILFLNTFFYLQLPLFYLYVQSVCFKKFKLKRLQLVYLLPFLIGNIILIGPIYLSKEFDSSSNNALEIQINYILLHTTTIYFLLLTFKILYVFKKAYFENYSNTETSIFNWLFQLTVTLSLVQIVAIIKNIGFFYIKNTFYSIAQITVGIIFLLITFWYVIKLLRYPQIFNGIEYSLQKEVNNNVLEDNTKKQSELFNQIESLMKTDEPYLEPELSLEKLAILCKLKPHELSILINSKTGSHFFDYINGYRIKKAKELLINDENKTILEILYEVGFNSKSSFNSSFKKIVHLTPTEFRKLNSKKNGLTF